MWEVGGVGGQGRGPELTLNAAITRSGSSDSRRAGRRSTWPRRSSGRWAAPEPLPGGRMSSPRQIDTRSIGNTLDRSGHLMLEMYEAGARKLDRLMSRPERSVVAEDEGGPTHG